MGPFSGEGTYTVEAMTKLCEALHDLPNIMGIGTMNEPLPGLLEPRS